MDISMLSPDMIDSAIAFGPDILQLLQIEIKTRKITYGQIATKIHSATGTVGSWFSRGAIPAEQLWGVVNAVGGAGLWMKALAKLPGNVFGTQYLNGMDQHPKQVIEDVTELAETLAEISKSTQKILRHKAQGYEFEGEDNQELIQFEDNLIDLISTGKMALVRIEEFYGRPVHEIIKRQHTRMVEIGYLQQEKKKPPVLAHSRL